MHPCNPAPCILPVLLCVVPRLPSPNRAVPAGLRPSRPASAGLGAQAGVGMSVGVVVGVGHLHPRVPILGLQSGPCLHHQRLFWVLEWRLSMMCSFYL